MHNLDRLPSLERLLAVMVALRDPETGCPWDKQQTFESIIPHTIEEAYEVVNAILHEDTLAVKDELGDLLFQVVFYARLAQEQGDYDFLDVVDNLSDKLIRRHPHVFANDGQVNPEQLDAQWQAIKQQERQAKGQGKDTSVLANLSAGMSPLLKADKLQKRCAKVGFDWPELEPVVDKIKEEIDEVLVEINAPSPKPQAIEDEVGDLLFAVVNLARHAGVNPELALIKANNKFERRFRQVEQKVEKQSSLQEASLADMELAWQQVKAQE
jgi:ATP diphosphatase